MAAAAYLERAIAMLAAMATQSTLVEERFTMGLDRSFANPRRLGRFFLRHFSAFFPRLG